MLVSGRVLRGRRDDRLKALFFLSVVPCSSYQEHQKDGFEIASRGVVFKPLISRYKNTSSQCDLLDSIFYAR